MSKVSASEDEVESEEEHKTWNRVGYPDPTHPEISVLRKQIKRKELCQESDKTTEKMRPDMALRPKQITNTDGLDSEHIR